MKRFQTLFAVLLSLLFVPGLLLLLFELCLRLSPGEEPLFAWYLFVGFPLGIVLWFLVAGAVFRRKGILSRGPLWLWMNLLGYPLAWAALLFRIPSLLMQGFWLLFFFLPTTVVLAAAWAVVGLGFLLRRLIQSPPSPQRLRSIGRSLLLVLTAVAAVNVIISGGRYLNLRPASAYTDEGVYTFVPVEGYPTNVKVPGRQGTRNVYKITYRTTKQSPYTWTVEAVSRSAGEATVRAKEPVDRRVLSITGTETFITVPAEETAESYTAGERNRCLIIFGGSAGYLTAAAVVVIWRKRQAEDKAALT